MCGEHYQLHCLRNPDRGSSPRVRGTLDVQNVGRGLGGIIPACAGNTNALLKPLAPKRDHPRVCGEHTIPQIFLVEIARDHPRVCGEHAEDLHERHIFQGSSPRVRGTRLSAWSWPTMAGIIPACAGNTGSTSTGSTPPGDHPRVCGEHTLMYRWARMYVGSSPRVRGTLARRLLQQALRGIIPACAGNTGFLTDKTVVCGDHPRVCGEHKRRTSRVF